jgi:ribonucleoside-diphosphate reductase alpha chain
MNKELLDYFNNDELAANVWLGKYAQERDKTPDDMHKRMASEFARIEYKYQHDLEQHVGRLKPEKWNILSHYGRHRDELDEDTIYELFKDFKYIVPQGSIMSNLGNKAITSLSNCFVIGQPTDSYGGICKKDEEMVQLMKRRGGVGIDLSSLRPAKTLVSNAAKTSTGVVSFMHRYSNSTREVAQDGRRKQFYN